MQIMSDARFLRLKKTPSLGQISDRRWSMKIVSPKPAFLNLGCTGLEEMGAGQECNKPRQQQNEAARFYVNSL